MADGILKTMPNTGTYYPPKIMVDGRWRYIVGITEWHDHEHDAREAHRLRAILSQAEGALDLIRCLAPDQEVVFDEDGRRYRRPTYSVVAERALAAIRGGR